MTFGGDGEALSPEPRHSLLARQIAVQDEHLRAPAWVDLTSQGLYASISADGLVAGSGFHVMARDQLERYREAVAGAASGRVLEAAVTEAVDAGLELWGESLRTAPRGYPKDHERIDLLRGKSLSLGARMKAERGIGRDAALEFVAGTGAPRGRSRRGSKPCGPQHDARGQMKRGGRAGRRGRRGGG